MRVVCINNDRDPIDSEYDYELYEHQIIIDDNGLDEHLTICKIYEVIDIDISNFDNPDEIYYNIKNSTGLTFWYSSRRFKNIGDHRDGKLNELGL